MANRRTSAGVSSPTKGALGRGNSFGDSKRDSSSLASKYGAPGAAPVAAVAAPPPYSPGGVARAGSVKKAPPPPPPMKRGGSSYVKQPTCTALFDFAAQVSPVEIAVSYLKRRV